MYAVVETGGKQYKVEEGTSLLVDRLSAKEGDKVALRAVMFRDEVVVAKPEELEKVKVEATVAEHLRGPKIKVFKYKPKKGYRRRAGHRSELTKLEVTEVKMLTRKAAPKAEPVEKEPVAKKPAAAKKPAGKKAAAKKPAAKGPAVKKEDSDGS
jgi:large subunit ribosomal protein L21